MVRNSVAEKCLFAALKATEGDTGVQVYMVHIAISCQCDCNLPALPAFYLKSYSAKVNIL